MNSKYIDKNSFEIVNNVFEVDEDIADTISVLNKKGYKTLFCCSGHVRDSRLFELYHLKFDHNYDEMIKDGYVINKSNEEYDLLSPYSDTHIYIKFFDNYNFDILPVGFMKFEDNVIDKVICYYNKNSRKASNLIEKEIKDSNLDLLNWANSLNFIK
ncbi:MAG: hypothetical protein RSE21_04775 [Bacilli bacterium]